MSPHHSAAPPEQFVEPALRSRTDGRGGAARVPLVRPGRDKGQGASLGSSRAPAGSESRLHRSRSGVEALRPGVAIFNKYRASL